MCTAAITFDQMERRADHALAVTLWAKHAKHVATCAAWMALLNAFTKGLVISLSTEKLESLSTEQAIDLKKKLQELHMQLTHLLTMRPTQELRRKVLFSGSLRDLEETTEDIGDIIEDLVLAENDQFKAMLKDRVEALSQVTVGSVDGM